VCRRLDHSLLTPYTVLTLPVVSGLIAQVGLSCRAAYRWRRDTTLAARPECSSTFEESGQRRCRVGACCEQWADWLSQLPVDRYHYQATARAVAAGGLALTLILTGAKLDGGELRWSGVLGPIAAVQFAMLAIGVSGFVIQECISYRFWTAFSRGWNTKVTMCLPPLCVFEFLLMVQLDKMEGDRRTMEWSTVFTPFWVFGALWLLSESVCQCCCMDDGVGVDEFEQLTDQSQQQATRVRSHSQVELRDFEPAAHSNDLTVVTG